MVIIFASIAAKGQNKNMKAADIQYNLKAYNLAIDSYLEYLENHPDDVKAISNLADSYAKTNDLIASARWYEKIVNMPETKDYFKIQYGKVLMKLGLYDEAKLQFGKLTQSFPGFAKQYMESCDFAKNILALGDRFVISQDKNSSVNDDFGPIEFKGALWLSTYIPKNLDNESLVQKNVSSLYRYDKMGSNLVALGKDNAFYNWIGPVRFFNNKVIYTRNYFENGMTQISGNEKDLNIFMADVDENGNFVNEESLPFNGEDYSTAFACFGSNENEIYFCSNKDSDNFDIYSATKENGKWSNPIKLPALINGVGNEITPYFSNNKLYFSSDFFDGLGGYDVFKTTKYENEWSFPVNLGKGVNSPMDDVYYIKNESEPLAYFSSNRLGTKGGLDVFSAKESKAKTRKSDDEVVYIPEAVKLTSLQEKGQRVANNNIKTVSENSNCEVIVSLEGAKMVAYDEVLLAPSNVYFIQLASLSSTKKLNSKDYSSLTKFGNVYKVAKSDATKIRLGYFVSQEEAEAVLASVRKSGFKDAFLVEDYLNTKELELLESSYTFTNTQKYVKPASTGNYKIKLAAYTNPLYFDVNKVKDLGVIEQWSKGNWTIFILSGYADSSSASDALVKVKNRGFASAELVLDNEGILTTIKDNQ